MAEPALAFRRSEEDAAHAADEPAFPLRFVTAASLFDGHDAAINVMRRLLQGSGGEVVHLGHNRAVEEVVTAAIHEDVHAVAVSSYQGGHIEYFRYMLDMLRERGAGHVRIFGGGGGVIVPEEVRELHDYGVTRIYTPEDGQRMGLEGMMDDVFERARGALDASASACPGTTFVPATSARSPAPSRASSAGSSTPESSPPGAGRGGPRRSSASPGPGARASRR